MTPAGRHAITYDEESWKPTPEEVSNCKEESCTLERHQSTTKKVRNYLKKCRNVLSNRSTSSDNQNSSGSTSSWYVDKQISVHECQIVEIEDVFENLEVVDVSLNGLREVANIVEVKGRTEVHDGTCDNEGVYYDETNSSPTLTELQGQVEEIEDNVDCSLVVDEVETQTTLVTDQESSSEARKEHEAKVSHSFICIICRESPFYRKLGIFSTWSPISKI